MERLFVFAALPVAAALDPLFGRSELPSATHDGIPAVKQWAQDRLVASRAGKTYTPSPAAWADHVTYQIMTDRFNNGNHSNDVANVQIGGGSAQGALMNTPNLASLPLYSHGGDLQGLIDRLDYLKDLGVSLIFLNPIFGHNGAYHGYW